MRTENPCVPLTQLFLSVSILHDHRGIINKTWKLTWCNTTNYELVKFLQVFFSIILFFCTKLLCRLNLLQSMTIPCLSLSGLCQSFLVSRELTLLKSISQVFCKMPSRWIYFPDIFSWLRLCIWDHFTIEMMCSSQWVISGHDAHLII